MRSIHVHLPRGDRWGRCWKRQSNFVLKAYKKASAACRGWAARLTLGRAGHNSFYTHKKAPSNDKRILQFDVSAVDPRTKGLSKEEAQHQALHRAQLLFRATYARLRAREHDMRGARLRTRQTRASCRTHRFLLATALAQMDTEVEMQMEAKLFARAFAPMRARTPSFPRARAPSAAATQATFYTRCGGRGTGGRLCLALGGQPRSYSGCRLHFCLRITRCFLFATHHRPQRRLTCWRCFYSR